MRALQGARRNASCGGCWTAPFGVLLPCFLIFFVARMERSEIRDQCLSFLVVPGFRFTSSGLQCAAPDRDGSGPPQAECHLTKIEVAAKNLLGVVTMTRTQKNAPRERYRSSAPAKRGRGTARSSRSGRSVVEGACGGAANFNDEASVVAEAPPTALRAVPPPRCAGRDDGRRENDGARHCFGRYLSSPMTR